jgi:hypothetical protein
VYSTISYCAFEIKSYFRFDLQPGAKPKLGSGDKEDTVIGLLRNLPLEGLGPQWIRPFPPRLPVQEGEVRNILSVYF